MANRDDRQQENEEEVEAVVANDDAGRKERERKRRSTSCQVVGLERVTRTNVKKIPTVSAIRA